MEEKKKKITGGDLLVKCLLEEDVKYLFGIIGGQLMRMFDAIYRWGREKGIDTVMFRHEEGAAHAADAWSRVTNKPGVCFGTVGPGATNLVPGVGAAWADNIPIVVIVPQNHTSLEDKFSLQGMLDQVALFKPITKYQISVRKGVDIPKAVQKAFREAVSGRPGPVLLEIYEDAFMDQIYEDKVPVLKTNQYRAISKPAIDNKLIEESLDLLLKAEKPLIVSGGGVARAEGWDELREFAEYFQIPVITTVMGRGTISNKSKCYIGATAFTANFLPANQADVILSLGCKFGYLMFYGEEPIWRNSQKLIQVDIDPTIVGRSKPITIGVVGDCKQFLTQILNKAKTKEKVETREWLDKLDNIHQKAIEATTNWGANDEIPISPHRLVKEVLEFIDDDAILISDGGNITNHTGVQLDNYKERKPLSTLGSVSMGHLGTSIPYGIGAKLAKPDTQVVSITGDGSFMFNIQDLETAVRLGLKNLIYVIGNDSAWGMIKASQKFVMKKRYIDTDLPDFDYAKCAEGFGCYGEKVTDPNEIRNALERAKASNKPAVIDVKIKDVIPDIAKTQNPKSKASW